MTQPPPRVLVVDDDAAVRDALDRALRGEGFAVRAASGGVSGLEAVAEWAPDAIVLDVAMPDLNGRAVCARLRAGDVRTPILILSARDQVDERVAGLQAGADDYLVKPFALPELIARLEALLRRARERENAALEPADASEPDLVVGDLVVSPSARTARRGDEPLELTRREFDLLETLARNAGIVLSRERLLELVWGYDFEVDGNVVDVFVGYLRRKTEAGAAPRMIETVRGVGFRLGGG